MSCCAPRATGPDTPGQNVSMENVGGGAELYIDFSGPDPFLIRTLVGSDNIIITQLTQTIKFDLSLSMANEGGFAEVLDDTASTVTSKLFRTIQSSNASVSVTQNTDNIDLTVPVLSFANEGGFAEVFDDTASTATSKLFRTLQSSDLSVSITQNADNIDLRVPAFETYYSSKTDIVSNNTTTYVTVSTMASVAAGAPGEVWVFVCSCLVCHPSGLSTVNTRFRWQIETSSGVYANLETDININEPQTIAAGQRSSPRTRVYQSTLNMISPTIRLQVSMSAGVATGGQIEYAQVAGYKR